MSMTNCHRRRKLQNFIQFLVRLIDHQHKKKKQIIKHVPPLGNYKNKSVYRSYLSMKILNILCGFCCVINNNHYNNFPLQIPTILLSSLHLNISTQVTYVNHEKPNDWA